MMTRLLRFCIIAAIYLAACGETNRGGGANIQCINGKIDETPKSCKCKEGWNGKACDQDINECKLNLCNKNGTASCHNTQGGYNCTCKVGWEGKNCNQDKDTCYPNPCHNNGTCIDKTGWHQCQCTPGYVGVECAIKCPACSNRSTCEYNVTTKKAFCLCKKGMVGPTCEKDRDECSLIPGLCHHGTCMNTPGSYKCNCTEGWEGSQCKNKKLYCVGKPCGTHGVCTEQEKGYKCQCEQGFTDTHCDKRIDPCHGIDCNKHGECKSLTSPNPRYECQCYRGFTGSQCQKEQPCHSKPCKNGATCKNIDDTHRNCTCKDGWTGDDCAEESPCKKGVCKNGGTCLPKSDGDFTCKCQNGYDGPHCEKKVKEKCLIPGCERIKDRGCRKECNTHECGWDSKACSLGVSPWQNCTANKCWQKFEDGKCDPECNNEICAFDGHDCDGLNKNCSYEAYCKKVFGNGECNSKCNNHECGFDGPDCVMTPEDKYVPGKLIVIVRSTKEEFESKKTEFIMKMSRMLNARVIIVSIVEIDIIDGPTRVRRAAVNTKRLQIKMRLDNTQCTKDCFRTTASAARFIAAKKARGKLDHLPFEVVKITPEREPPAGPIGISPLWIASCVAVPLLLLGVIAFTRKVVTRLWHPEGDNRFAVNDLRREPLGQEGDEMTNLQRRESVSGGSHVSPSGSCSDSPNSVGDAKRMKVEMVGSLGSSDWLNVKGVLRDQSDSPGGVVHIPASSDGTLAKASCGDGDGETNLHVAARLSRTELARQLIEFGIDINARNKSGKTPLHLAVSSLADGVFQLLIRNRSCQIDVQDYEGRTALMNACHCVHNVMVDELISNGAKVNLVDSLGKTSLHCAAMVDNDKAVVVLLKNGAKVDSQDNKGQTPLFLAARDGALSSAYFLLANYANRNCADSMDVTPMKIAIERGQKDLIALLSDWTGSPPGMMTSPSRNSPPDLSSPSSGTISPTPCSQYSDIRPKLPTSYGQMNGNTNNNNNNPIKPPMKRKRKSTKNAKEKSPVEKNHPSFLNNFPNSISDVYPTPRSSMDKREAGLPELNSAEILEGMNAIYPPLEQINSMPTNWSQSIMSGVHGHGPGHGPGHQHYQFNHNMMQNTRQFQYPQTTTHFNPYDCMPGRTFPTPPSVDVESPNDTGSPIDNMNVLPSPFLTPSPETWGSNSPGNSDHSAC